MKARWGLTIGAALILSIAAYVLAVLLDAQSRTPEVILAKIIQLTPLGSTVSEVEVAIRGSGRGEGMCWTETKEGKKTSITVRYAESLQVGVPPARSIIEAHWHFDPHGRLVEIALDYYSDGIVSIGFSKVNDTPITLSGLQK